MVDESILVVDDVKEHREIAYQILIKMGYYVKTLSSGEEAVEYMQSNSADLLELEATEKQTGGIMEIKNINIPPTPSY